MKSQYSLASLLKDTTHCYFLMDIIDCYLIKNFQFIFFDGCQNKLDYAESLRTPDDLLDLLLFDSSAVLRYILV